MGVLHQKVKTYHIDIFPSDCKMHIFVPLCIWSIMRCVPAIAAWLICIRKKLQGFVIQVRELVREAHR